MKKLIFVLLVFAFIFNSMIIAYAQTEKFETRIGKSVDYDVNNDSTINWLDKIALWVDPYTVGDADNDGDVDLSDYTIIKTYISVGYDDIDPQADADEDSSIDAFDLFAVDKYITLGEQTVINR